MEQGMTMVVLGQSNCEWKEEEWDLNAILEYTSSLAE